MLSRWTSRRTWAWSFWAKVYELCERIPEHIVLNINPQPGSPLMERLLAGDWPKKRNLIVAAWACSLEEGKELLERLREAVP